MDSITLVEADFRFLAMIRQLGPVEKRNVEVSSLRRLMLGHYVYGWHETLHLTTVGESTADAYLAGQSRLKEGGHTR